MGKQRGFSLIELLIVVTIILVISAIAIPNLMRSRIAANEAATVANVRRIASAEVSYAATFNSTAGLQGYSNDMPSLGGTSCVTPSSTSACLIDNDLAQAIVPNKARSGFYYTYALSDARGFTLNADPATYGTTGLKHFYTDATQSIRYTNTDTPAGQNDPAVQ